MEQTTEKPTRKERKKARKDLMALLRRLRRSCKTMDQISDWYDLATDVEAIVNENGRAIPTRQRQRLQEALKLPEATMTGVGQACRVLQSEVAKTAAAVGGASTLAGTALMAAVTVVLLTAVVILAATVVANQTAVDVHIINKGCGPFDVTQVPFADSSILSLIGLRLPPEAIASGGNVVITIPPLRLKTDNVTDPNKLSIRGPGQVKILLPVSRATDIRLNGQSLLGVQRTIDLAGADEHVLEVSCGE